MVLVGLYNLLYNIIRHIINICRIIITRIDIIIIDIIQMRIYYYYGYMLFCGLGPKDLPSVQLKAFVCCPKYFI